MTLQEPVGETVKIYRYGSNIIKKQTRVHANVQRNVQRVVCNIYVIYKNLCFEYRANVFFLTLLYMFFLKK